MRDKRVRRVLALFAVGVLSLGSVLGLATAEAKQLVPYVLYDSNGQLLGLTTNFDEEFATVRQGAFFLKYNLRRPWHGTQVVAYSTPTCTGPAFSYALPDQASEVSGWDKRYLGFSQNKWYQLDPDAGIGLLKDRKASDAKIYFSDLNNCVGERVRSGSGVLYDEMLAVPLKEIEINPNPASLKYPLFVEEYDSDEEYEISGEISVQRVADGYWISVTTSTPSQPFKITARLGGKKQLRLNSRTGSDGFKRLTTKQDLNGVTIRLLIDGDLIDETVALP